MKAVKQEMLESMKIIKGIVDAVDSFNIEDMITMAESLVSVLNAGASGQCPSTGAKRLIRKRNRSASAPVNETERKKDEIIIFGPTFFPPGTPLKIDEA